MTATTRTRSTSSQRQAAALRAGLALLALAGDAVDATGARLSLSSHDFPTGPVLYVAVYGDDAGDDATVLRAGIRAVADALGLPLTLAYDSPDSLGLDVETRIGNVKVRVDARFTDPADITAARALLTPTAVTA